MPTPDKDIAIQSMLSAHALGSSDASWQSVALRLGEHLAAVGPNGYYDFTPEQWLTWVLGQPGVRGSDPCGDAEVRAALVGLVGVDTRAELEELEAALRLMRAPAKDKAATIDAVHALLATLPPEPLADA